MVNVGVVGCGYWGPNYIRIFNELLSSLVTVACDIDPKQREHIKRIYPSVRTCENWHHILDDEKVDAVCIATPASSHYPMAKESLLHGKHVLVEKPLALHVSEVEDLARVAEEKKKILMVGHVYLYHPVARKMKEYVENGLLGQLYYLYSTRTGLGPIRNDVNAMWDLAPHDISMCIHLLDRMPTKVSARGASYLQKDIEDVVFLTLEFPEGVIASIHLSWLDPYKIRRMTLVGKEKMMVFDDTDPVEKLRIFDKGASMPESASSYGDFLLQVRMGDVNIPRIESMEPLKVQCEHFLECIEKNQTPLTNAKEGQRVTKVLEAASRSLEIGGSSVDIKS